jgi:hypothetical protein
MLRRCTLSVLVVALLLLAGCAGKGDSSGAGETTSTDESPPLSAVAPPGIYDLPGGSTEALGILTYRDLEGGFWAVAKTSVPEQAETAEIVAVVVPSAELAPQLESLRGQYVSVVGIRNVGPSIYMAGPVLEAQSIERVTDLKE